MPALTITMRISELAPPFVAERIRLEMDNLDADPEEFNGATCYDIGWFAPGIRYSRFVAFKRMCVEFGEYPGSMVVSLVPSPILASFPIVSAILLGNALLAPRIETAALLAASMPLAVAGLALLSSYLRVRYWLRQIGF